ncbi:MULTISPECIES: helix-turn-helix domain-containing protein [Pseudosulfitobacter]|uniref:helix-turn-helix domain-containing protein n=1 Tax=Pseudosulfitobacter pseudonitzschiae TaxID=1402135 RepID=UPI000934D1A4|nr:helix-turn-helix domain-containing protein [Pseudosulfitobacter pseudonitzschiae]
MSLPLLKPIEAATFLGVCTKTLQECRRNGLKYVKVAKGAIRYRADDLEEYIEAQTQCHSEPRRPVSINTTSSSGVIAFEDLAGRKTSRQRRQ